MHDTQMLPESDDSILVNNYPDWIHKGDYCSEKYMMTPWASPLVNELNACDFVIVSYNGPMFLPFVRTKSAFLVTGGDLTTFPFPYRYGQYYSSLFKKAGAYLRAFWQTKGIKKADHIWSQPFQPFMIALRRLGLEKHASSLYFPVLIDENKFNTDNDQYISSSLEVDELRATYDDYIFYPSRVMTDSSSFKVETGQWKQNDLFVKGFARFVHNNPQYNIGLAFIDKRTASGESKDVLGLKSLIEELGIDDHVSWLKPRQQGGFTREELIPIYSAAIAVADDFGVGWFGSVVLEGLALSKPVISYVDDAVMTELYDGHPILSVRTVDGIADMLRKIASDDVFRRDVSESSRRWFVKNHSVRNMGDIYMSRLRDALNA